MNAPDPTYRPIQFQMDNGDLFESPLVCCNTCGAVVGNVEAHNGDHSRFMEMLGYLERLAENVLRMAARQNQMTP